MEDFKKIKLKQLKENRKLIGERIKIMRERYGYDRTHLSVEIGLPPNSIGQYERGISSPQPYTLVKLADKFYTTTDYLTGKTDDPSLPNKVQVDVEELINKAWVYKGVELTEEEKKGLYKMLEVGLNLINKD